MPTGGVALDIGCGTGGTFELFERLGCAHGVGVDLADDALRLARRKRPTAHLVRADASAPLPFGQDSFDLVTVFNVLCHAWIADEVQTLRQISALMKPGGLIAITEPAFEVLTRRLDKLVMSRRRYRLAEMTAMAAEAGLQPVRTGYFGSAAFVPALGLALMDRLSKEDGGQGHGTPLDLRVPPAWLNRLFLFLTNLDGRAIAAGFAPPFGITLIGVYRKVV